MEKKKRQSEESIVRNSNMEFDKFIDDIYKRESDHREKVKKSLRTESDDPIRRLYKRYQELPQNRTVVRRRDGK